MLTFDSKISVLHIIYLINNLILLCVLGCITLSFLSVTIKNKFYSKSNIWQYSSFLLKLCPRKYISFLFFLISCFLILFVYCVLFGIYFFEVSNGKSFVTFFLSKSEFILKLNSAMKTSNKENGCEMNNKSESDRSSKIEHFMI